MYFGEYVWTGSLILEIATTNQKKSVKYKNKKKLQIRFGIRLVLSLWTERKEIRNISPNQPKKEILILKQTPIFPITL